MAAAIPVWKIMPTAMARWVVLTHMIRTQMCATSALIAENGHSTNLGFISTNLGVYLYQTERHLYQKGRFRVQSIDSKFHVYSAIKFRYTYRQFAVDGRRSRRHPFLKSERSDLRAAALFEFRDISGIEHGLERHQVLPGVRPGRH
jgi:hypothetical protein